MRDIPLICVVGESGSGKTAIVEASKLKPVLSHTSRGMREGEKDGVDYIFKSRGWMTANKKSFPLDFSENYGNFYAASDSELMTKEVFIVDPHKAIDLKYKINAHIVWIKRDKPVKSYSRQLRSEPDFPALMEVHADDIIYNNVSLHMAAKRLKRIRTKLVADYTVRHKYKVLEGRLEYYINLTNNLRQQLREAGL